MWRLLSFQHLYILFLLIFLFTGYVCDYRFKIMWNKLDENESNDEELRQCMCRMRIQVWFLVRSVEKWGSGAMMCKRNGQMSTKQNMGRQSLCVRGLEQCRWVSCLNVTGGEIRQCRTGPNFGLKRFRYTVPNLKIWPNQWHKCGIQILGSGKDNYYK